MNTKVKEIVQIAMFSALSLVVSLISVPLPFIPNFYKIDLSTAIAVLIGFKYGCKEGVLVELIKNLLSVLLLGSNTMVIGELANFLMGISFIVPMVTLKNKIKYHSVVAIITLSIVGCVLNYFVLLPVYMLVLNMHLNDLIAIGHAINPMINSLLIFVLLAVLPFNLIKGSIIALVSNLLYKRIK